MGIPVPEAPLLSTANSQQEPLLNGATDTSSTKQSDRCCSRLCGQGIATIILAVLLGAAGGGWWARKPNQVSSHRSRAGQWSEFQGTERPGIVAPPTVADRFVQDPLLESRNGPSFTSRLRVSNQRNNLFVLRAFHEAIGDAWKATVRVVHGGDMVALGLIIDPGGWLVTKASQLPAEGDVYCQLYDGREFPAQIAEVIADHDLALLHVDATELPTARWSDTVPVRGAWLATLDASTTPRAVGVVSTGVVRVEEAAAVLGVNLTDTVDGPAVVHVLPGTGADGAGLRIGDTILEVDDQKVDSLRSFRRAIRGLRGGDEIDLKILRGQHVVELTATLMDLTDELLNDTEMEVNGSISARATGFEQVFMHDTVLAPHECGGPLVNLKGEVVGLNIARSGRVTSYALPTSLVRPVLEDALARITTTAAPAPRSATSPGSPAVSIP
ncbi:MAG: hypothetical protein KatS3mg111_3728 [Pirellulaceae bacterium]|nr:MAG: hypothetical protein KatS3mg111_3728 [Pirellulaceae bacterium]